MHILRFLSVLFIAGIAFVQPSQVRAAESQSFVVGTTSNPDILRALMIIGKAQGIDARHDLDVTFKGGKISTMTALLASGDIDAHVFAGPALWNVARNGCTAFLWRISPTMQAGLVIRDPKNQIKKVTDLKGKIAALSSLTNAHAGLFRTTIGTYVPNKVGFTGPRLRAVLTGEADFGFLYQPYPVVAQMLPELRILDVEWPSYPSDMFVANCSQVKANRGKYESLVRFLNDTLAFVQDPVNIVAVKSALADISVARALSTINKIRKARGLAVMDVAALSQIAVDAMYQAMLAWPGGSATSKEMQDSFNIVVGNGHATPEDAQAVVAAAIARYSKQPAWSRWSLLPSTN